MAALNEIATNEELPASPAASLPIWVGQLGLDESVTALRVEKRFVRAQLVVTMRKVPVGQVSVDLVGGYASVGSIRSAIASQLGHLVDAPPAARLESTTRPITVVVPTRHRPESLVRCIRSVLAGDHPAITVIAVDNAPDDDLTERALAGLHDPRVTYLREDRPGTSAARNRGLAAATARGDDLVAFVDDDVEVDRGWAGRMAAALSEPGIECVCGPVFAARLDTSAQVTADTALGWRKGFVRRRFTLTDPPADSAIFPFSPGMFGVGANMAVSAPAALRRGGFDPALGPGTAARGGEDCDFMIRVVLAGGALRYEPSAYVWHHHRPSDEELDAQLSGYSRGLGGFLAKILLDSSMRGPALRRAPAALVQLTRIRRREIGAGAGQAAGQNKIRGMALGAVAYLRARRRAQRHPDAGARTTITPG